MSFGNDNESVIGIDFGNCFCSVGVWENNQKVIIPNDFGKTRIRSYVAFTETDILVGDEAYNQSTMNISNTIYDIGRLIGRTSDDPYIRNKHFQFWPFEIVIPKKEDETCREGFKRPVVQVESMKRKENFYFEEILAILLSHLKKLAVRYLGKIVKKCVIAIPGTYNNSQRQAVKDSCVIAGLHPLRLVPGTTLAAISYGVEHLSDSQEERNMLIFDCGGGKTNVSIVTTEQGIFEVKAISGEDNLGGSDFDTRLVEHFSHLLKRKYRIDLKSDQKSIARLRKACEGIKANLTIQNRTTLELFGLMGNQCDVSEVISRAKFEQLNSDLFRTTLKYVQKCLEDANLERSEIHDIIFVGGSTRIQKIQHLVRDYFRGKEPRRGFHPEEAVIRGAVIQAEVISGKNIKDVLVLDVIAHSVGIETAGGVMTRIIPKNTTLPCTKSKIFTTYQDNQNEVKVPVYAGERGLTKDNVGVAVFFLRNLHLAPRGVPKIEVRFQIDQDGILQVNAHDKMFSKVGPITVVKESENLSVEEIGEMKKKWVMFGSSSSLGGLDKKDLMERCSFLVENLDEIYDDDESKIGDLTTKIYFSDGKKFENVLKILF